MDVRVGDEGLQLVEVLADEGRGGTVIAFHEVVDESLHVLVGVPEELGEDPATQFGELAVIALVGSLLHDADDMVVAEELEVALQRAEVREGAEVVLEVGSVVPDEEFVGQAAPALDVLHELAVVGQGRDIQRRGKIALNGAKARDDVVAGPDIRWRCARVLVSQRLDEGVREFLFDLFRHLVDKPDEQAGLAAVALR